ncbi:MAG: UvrD-helicase domain-containing protein, partial [Verrucomicrobia bacterium]|nr:UvrD-helicase domain-containing protein [Verrucomicrobiota bacterium]
MTAPSHAPVGHLAISASAGSGKTFQLAHRYVRLLASGMSADRICALTFSRKAAGEIFDEIVNVLVRAAATLEGANTVSRHAGITSPGPTAYLAHLRRFLGALHRLHIGTLD